MQYAIITKDWESDYEILINDFNDVNADNEYGVCNPL